MFVLKLSAWYKIYFVFQILMNYRKILYKEKNQIT